MERSPTALLLGSQNPGKLAEMRQLVAHLPFAVVGPSDAGAGEAPMETGKSFRENAALKAIHYSRLTGLLTLADDSGLSVDALDGGPGLYSSSFGGDGLTDEGRTRLLLARLEGVPAERRGARFTSAVAIAKGGRILYEVEKSVEGRITTAPRGDGGFGYDPVFFSPRHGATFAELDPKEKDRVSHRGRAFAEARAFLERLIG